MGPLKDVPPWDDVIVTLQNAHHKQDEQGIDDSRLSDVYRHFANRLEHELCNVTDTTLKIYGTRGEEPKLVWRSILPEAGVVA